MEMEFASNAKGNLATTLGAIGTGLGALNGGLGGIFGNNGYTKELAEKDAQIAELRSEKYSDRVGLDLYRYIDGKLIEFEKRFGQQDVLNQANKDSFQLVTERLQNFHNELHGDIERECERRTCADNSIVNYLNATFYPKLVADVTAGTTTTAQTVYNPLPCQTCGCGK